MARSSAQGGITVGPVIRQPSISGLIAPTRPTDRPQPWKGSMDRKPWDYRVTVVIPHLDTVEQLQLCVDVLRCQTEAPYIQVIDTGSLPENLAFVEMMRAPDLEVHTIRGHGWQHPSEVISVACQLGQDMARSPFVFQTHADCFLVNQKLLAEWSELAKIHKVVGYQISPRPYPGWESEYGHTALMVDVVAIRKAGVNWNLRSFAHRFPDIPDCFNISPNRPDTESEFNATLKEAGIIGLMLGGEENYVRNTNADFDHPRSFCSSKLYSLDHHQRIKADMEQAMFEARGRISWWRACLASNARPKRLD